MNTDDLLQRYAAGERDFSGAKLGKKNLSKAHLLNINLRAAYLSGTILTEANLAHTDLDNADLLGANLQSAFLFRANLLNANLSRTNLSYASLCNATLNGANLSGANLSYADLRNASLIEANLNKAILYGADLSRANLAYAKLNGANLSNVELSDVNLAGIDLKDTKLNGLKLNGIILYQTENYIAFNDKKITWASPLQSLQHDFIQRIRSGYLLHCQIEGQHSELTVISDKRLKQLRDFCWIMADKYKRNFSVRKLFENNMKGKLGEEVIKIRLAKLVTEVDYERRMGGDGKVDFRLTADPSIGIQVKTRYGQLEQVKWEISLEEIKENTVVVCILNQEEFDDMKSEYKFVIAGFLPTNMIQISHGKTYVWIDELLYGGALKGYLQSVFKETKA